MVDISMCGNKSCCKKNECYRFMAVPDNLRQTYSDYKVRISGKPAQDCFIQVEKGHRIREESKCKE